MNNIPILLLVLITISLFCILPILVIGAIFCLDYIISMIYNIKRKMNNVIMLKRCRDMIIQRISSNFNIIHEKSYSLNKVSTIEIKGSPENIMKRVDYIIQIINKIEDSCNCFNLIEVIICNHKININYINDKIINLTVSL